MEGPQFFLNLLDGGKQRTLGTAGTQAGGTGRQVLHQGSDVRLLKGSLQTEHSAEIQGKGDILPTGGQNKAGDALQHHLSGVLACHGHDVLAEHPGLHIPAPEHGLDALFDVFRLSLLQDQHLLLAHAKIHQLIGHQGIGDVQTINGDVGIAVNIGEALALQGTNDSVVGAAAGDDAQALVLARKQFIELLLLDELHRRRQPTGNFFLLMLIDKGRQNDLFGLTRGCHRGTVAVAGWHIVPGNKLSGHVAAADAHHVEDRGIGRLGQLKTFLHHVDNRRQVGARVQQPHLGLHGEGIGALLHDAGAFTVVLAHNHHRAPGHTGRGKIGERVRGHIGTHRGFPGNCATQRVIDGSREHGRRRGLGTAGFKVHPQFAEDVLGIAEHIHQMGNG